MTPHLRIARPVTDLAQSKNMYCLGLSLQELGGFSEHDGFSGVMLGRSDLNWHLEFTVCHRHPVEPAATVDDLLVLYYPDNSQWQKTCQQMLEAGFLTINSFNPYWDISGRTFIDNDGYRVVLQNRAWPAV